MRELAAIHPAPFRPPSRYGRTIARAGAGAVLFGLLVPVAAYGGQAEDGLRFVEWQSQVPVQLGGAFDGALSPDGRSLYVVSLLDDAILHYRRDLRTGALSIEQAIGPGVVDAPASLAVSPDGRDVYAAAIVSDAVFHLVRDVNTGELGPLTRAPDPVGGAPLDGASSVALSPDGSRLYAVGLDDQRLFVYDRAGDGTLSAPQTFLVALLGARDVTVSPDGQDLYVAELQNDRLRVFRPQPSGLLLPLQELTEGVGGISGLDGPYTVATSPDGADVYVAAFDGGTLAHFDRDAATGLLSEAGVYGNGVGGIARFVAPLSVAVSDDGGSVYVTSHDPGGLFVFTRDGASGALSFVRAYDRASDPLSGLPLSGLIGAAGVVTRDGSVIVMGLLEHSVSVWERTGPGALRRIETQVDDPQIVLYPQQVVTVPGEPLVLAFGDDDCGGGTLCRSYSAFLRDTETGALTAILKGGFGSVVFNEARSVAISPDGRHVYLASDSSDAVLALVRPIGDVVLWPVGLYVDNVGIDGLAGVSDLVVSPDGAFVYAAGTGDSAVARFARDAQSGALTWLGITPAFSARQIAQSPDGRHLYVTAGSASLLAFARDPVSGALTSIDVEHQGVGGVTGLASPLAVAVSGDGRSVYVTDNSNPPLLSVFARDPPSGTLTWLESQYQGIGLVPVTVAVEAGGGHVYVGSAADGTIAVYRRDRATGGLLYLRTEGSSSFDPLRPSNIFGAFALSPEGRHLYVAGAQAVGVYSTDAIFVDGFEHGDRAAWSAFQPAPPPPLHSPL